MGEQPTDYRHSVVPTTAITNGRYHAIAPAVNIVSTCQQLDAIAPAVNEKSTVIATRVDSTDVMLVQEDLDGNPTSSTEKLVSTRSHPMKQLTKKAGSKPEGEMPVVQAKAVPINVQEAKTKHGTKSTKVASTKHGTKSSKSLDNNTVCTVNDEGARSFKIWSSCCYRSRHSFCQTYAGVFVRRAFKLNDDIVISSLIGLADYIMPRNVKHLVSAM